MSSGTQLINRAYKKIGVKFNNQDVTAETLDIGREELNSMLEEWLDEGIELDYVPISDPSDETNIPKSIENAVINNLAICLAPYFDDGKNIVSPALQRKATLGFARVKKQRKKSTPLNKTISGTVPRGMGSTRGLKPRMFFKNDGSLTGGGEGTFGSGGGTGGGGGGVPGPPGPPGPEGPQGPPGDEVFATQQEVLDGVVNNKSIAPDTLKGKFDNPSIIGAVTPAQQILVGSLDITTDFMLGTILNQNIGVIPLGTGRIVLKDFTTPSTAPVPTEILQVVDGFGNTDWKLPHTILNLTGGGDLVFNSGTDVLTRLPIGASNEVLESNGSLPEWRSPAKGANKNYFIDGDFSETFPTLDTAVDGTYITPLIHYLNPNSSATHIITREATTTLGTTSENRPAASLKIEVKVADATTESDARTTLVYDITGSDYSPLPNRKVVHSFICKSSVSGIYSIGYANSGLSRSLVDQFTLVANVEKLVELPFTTDTFPGNNWLVTDADRGFSIFINLAAGANFQRDPSLLRQWLATGFTASEDQVNFNAEVGSTFEITQLNFEEGIKARAFVPRERALVIKQLEWSVERWDFNSFSDEFAFSGNYEGVTGFQLVLPFRTKKRVAPFNGKSKISDAATWRMDVLGSSIDVTSISIIANSSANSILIEGSTSATTAGAGCSLKRKGTAIAFVLIDSRHRA